MAVTNIYSKRQKATRGEVPDVYQYDILSSKLKNQIIFIMKGAIGTKTTELNMTRRSQTFSGRIYENIRNTLIREYGETSLAGQHDAMTDIISRFQSESNIEICLDIIEVIFDIINSVIRSSLSSALECGLTQRPDDAISELNQRLKADGVGYEFVSGEIIRIDSEIIHSEVVKPALSLLQGSSHFDGAENEFLTAHEHYRHQRYKECIVECNKAFESCMKAICDNQGWTYNPKDPAKKLITTCLNNNLFPTYMQTQLHALESLLASGLPAVRNSNGGHGQGSNITLVDDELAGYALHLVATNIVFFAKSEKKLP